MMLVVTVAILDAKSYTQHGRWHGHKMERIIIAVMVAADGDSDRPVFEQTLHCLSMIWAHCSPSNNAFHYGEYGSRFVIGELTFTAASHFRTRCVSSINMQQCL